MQSQLIFKTGDNVKGIVRYGSSTDDPTTSAWSYTDSCDDENSTNLVPYLSMNVSDTSDVETSSEAGLQVTDNALLWTMGGYSFYSEWEYPTVLQVLDGNDTWDEKQRIIELPEVDQWVYFVISSVFAQAHPMHLHGHDFWVLGSGYGKFSNTTSQLNLVNPPRRDVVMLPASGWVVIAFKTDNPGVSDLPPLSSY